MQEFRNVLWRAPGGPGNESNIFGGVDHSRNGAAGLSGARKIPEIREIAALLRFHGLHGTFAALLLQEDALTARLIQQGQAETIIRQPRELLDEIEFAQSPKVGQPGDFRLCQTHLTRPATASRTPLTFQKNRHKQKLTQLRPIAKSDCGSPA